MKDLVLRFVYDRKNATGYKEKKPGVKYAEVGLLQIEVRQLKTDKRVYISTGIKIKPDQFTEKNGFTCKNHPNASLITANVQKKFREIEAFCYSDKCNSISDVRNWDKDEVYTTSIANFIRSELKRKDPSYAVIEHHNSLIRRLEQYGKIKVFSDLTYENILGFDEYLRKTIKSSPTLYKRHSLLKSYIREAIKRGLCKNNPYDIFVFHKGKSKEPVYLLESEIKKILDYDPPTDRLQKVKDLFIFQCFTGMAYIDVMNFNESCVYDQDGKKIIKSSRSKTDESFISLFLPEAERIAQWYGYDLPKISNQKYNDYLKLLATGCGITKNLTSHTARHTFATYLLNKDIPIETVARALGHANIKQTQHYARMLGKKVIDDMSKLL